MFSSLFHFDFGRSWFLFFSDRLLNLFLPFQFWQPRPQLPYGTNLVQVDMSVRNVDEWNAHKLRNYRLRKFVRSKLLIFQKFTVTVYWIFGKLQIWNVFQNRILHRMRPSSTTRQLKEDRARFANFSNLILMQTLQISFSSELTWSQRRGSRRSLIMKGQQDERKSWKRLKIRRDGWAGLATPALWRACLPDFFPDSHALQLVLQGFMFYQPTFSCWVLTNQAIQFQKEVRAGIYHNRHELFAQSYVVMLWSSECRL